MYVCQSACHTDCRCSAADFVHEPLQSQENQLEVHFYHGMIIIHAHPGQQAACSLVESCFYVLSYHGNSAIRGSDLYNTTTNKYPNVETFVVHLKF